MLGKFTKAHVGSVISAIAMISAAVGYDIPLDFQTAIVTVISTVLVWVGIWGPANAE